MTTSTTSEAVSTKPLAGCGALVTGGSRGIGRAIVERLVSDGAAVVFTYATQHESAEQLVAEITAQGSRARALQLDLAKSEQFSRVFAAADAALLEYGVEGLSVLVANAGVVSHAPIDQLSAAEWHRMMAINARGTFLTVQHAARRLRDRGRIIAVSTVGTAWPASKAAVEQVIRVASREYGSRGITANTVLLGPTDTDLLRAGAPQEALDGAAAMTALGRIGQPDDVADVVALLARAESRWITGQNICADGGLT